ncbi:MAG TPA: TIGR00730 family Rossman fold protein [Puia sp.]|jgi:hypothetical protein|nr:TIGR00730 family Rossman fold protein [Puia sp.]
MSVKSIIVFCGSQNGNDPLYGQHAAEIGKLIALSKMKLIYGGGKRGLMGVVADAVLANGGHVVGIIPELLSSREHQHNELTELAIVTDMHTRKKMLYQLGDIAIILPGGFGTLDELFEIVTWNQLKLHDKKIFVLNSVGFYDHLLKHLQQVQKEGFLYDDIEDKIIFCKTPAEIFNKIN